MTPYKVIGIDPGLAHCGLVVLESGASRRDMRVTAWTHVETSPKWDLLLRLRTLHADVRHFLHLHAPFDAVVVESPIGKSGRRGRTARAKGQYKSPHDISAQGVATGVELGVALDFPGTVAFIDADEWMPKTKSGNFTHTIARESLITWLRSEIILPPLVAATKKHEHVLMAAGVARYWIVNHRLEQRIVRETLT